MKPSIVYGPIPDSDDFAFVEESRALAFRQAWVVIRRSKNWREFWRDLPELHREWLNSCGQGDDEVSDGFPRDDSTFEPNLLPGYREGEFPGFAHTSGDSWTPEHLRDEYAKGVDSFVSGS